MIDDLRWIERSELFAKYDENIITKTTKVLQYSDGYHWFDVPTVRQTQEAVNEQENR